MEIPLVTAAKLIADMQAREHREKLMKMSTQEKLQHIIELQNKFNLFSKKEVEKIIEVVKKERPQ